MTRSGATACVLGLILPTIARGHAEEAKRKDPARDAGAVTDQCAKEKSRLLEAKRDKLDSHPVVVSAQVRVKAACQPTPSVACAEARADSAEAAARFLPNHPDVLDGRRRVEATCAPAPSEACARKRGDLAVMERTRGPSNPDRLRTQREVEAACRSSSIRQAPRPSSP
jgi:hypothetical protein